MSTLFISHSSRDNEESRKLESWLREHQYESVFLDLDPEKGIQAGASWEQTLYTKLRACRAVVALCSSNYLASHWCFAEIALARMEGKELFALQIDPWGEDTQLPSILTERQVIDLRSEREKGYERLRLGLKSLGIVAEKHRDWIPGKAPFPGLRAFDEKDAPIFFGRDDEILEGVELMTSVRRQGHPRLVMVLGSSGSGKSSLARAGILPRLRGDPDRWLVVGPLRPGAQPAAELARALDTAFGKAEGAPSLDAIYRRLEPAGEPPTEPAAGDAAEIIAVSARERLRDALHALEGELAADDPRLGESVRKLLEHLGSSATGAGPELSRSLLEPTGNRLADLANELRFRCGRSGATVVLVVDQFEELLGHEGAGSDHPANRFLALLKAGIEAKDAPMLALGTMRSDFLGLLQRSGPLRGVGFKSLSVGPMSDKGMLEVVERPAKLGGIQLEDGLTSQLLKETGTADALPLLAFTLRALWDRFHENRKFAIDDYDKMGRLQGAIAKVADDTLAAALQKASGGEEAGQREAELELRKAFLNLARPAAEGTGWARQPASWEKLPEDSRPMLEHFVEQRLLLKREDGTVEVAHEALFRSWKKLAGWLNESAEALHLRDEIAGGAASWDKAQPEEKNDHVWSGARLARALELRDGGLLDLSELARSFLEASDDAAQADRRAKEAQRQRELEQARKLAEEQALSARRTRRFLVAVAALLLVAVGFLVFAILKKRAAEDQTRVATARDLLGRDTTRAALVLLEVRKPEQTAYTVQLMSDALREPLALFELTGHGDEVTSVVFDGEGRRILSASKDHTARVWSLDEDGAPIESPGDCDLEQAGTPGEVPGGCYRHVVLRHQDHVLDAAFDPAGRRVVTASRDGTARVWNADGTPIRTLQAGARGKQFEVRSLVMLHEGEVTSAAFDPEGRRIVTGSKDGTARVWTAGGVAQARPVGGGQVVLDLGREIEDRNAAEVNGVAFGSEGKLIATATKDGAVRLWDAESGELLHTLAGHAESVDGVAFGPTGALVGATRKAEAGAWIVDPEATPVPTTTLVTGSRDRSGRVWKLGPDGSPLRTADGAAWFREMRHDESGGLGQVYGVAAGRGGDVVTASDDHTARLWRADGEPARSADGSRQIVFRHSGEINGVAFGPAGERVATASKDRTVRVWSVAGGTEPAVLPQERAWSARFTAAGEVLTSSDGRGGFQIWRPEADAAGRSAAAAEVWSIAPDRRLLDALPYLVGSDFRDDRIASVSTSDWERYTVRLWGADGTPLAGFPADGLAALGSDSQVPSAALSPPAGDRLVIAGGDEKGESWQARLWRSDGARVLRPDGSGAQVVLDHGGAELTGVSFGGPRGERLVTASNDKTARVWKADGSPLRTAGPGSPQVVLPHEAAVTLALFDPSGELIVTAWESHAQLWRADSGERVGLPMRHDNDVSAAAFSPRGDRLATGSGDYNARVWPLAGGGEPLVLRGHEPNVRSVSFGPKGDRLVTVAELQSARLWSLTSELLGARIRALTSVCLDPTFRVKTLREGVSEAERAFDRCRSCRQKFAAPGSGSDLEEAFGAYLRCVR